MGRGNWRPCQDYEEYDLRYFDLYERYNLSHAEDFFAEDYCEFFLEEIHNALPDSFWKVERGDRVDLGYHLLRQDNLVIFRNELVCIMIDSESYFDHVGVAMVRLDDYSPKDTWVRNFGGAYLRRSALPFWKRLGGDQSVRTSAWTSAKVA